MKSENGTERVMSETTAVNGSSNGTTNNPSTTPTSKKRSADPFKCTVFNYFSLIRYWFRFRVNNFDCRFHFPHSFRNLLFLASSRKRRKGNGSGASNQEPQPKNAVAILNELKKNLVYELESQEGPYHAPVFTMSVMVSRHRRPRNVSSLLRSLFSLSN